MNFAVEKSAFWIVYLVSVLCLLSMFVYTMFLHNEAADYEYLAYATIHILLVSVVPALIGGVLKPRSLLMKILVGVISAPLIAAIYIQLRD
jgi:hypothetical protein